MMLHHLGILYFGQKNYRIALACFLLTKSIFTEAQSPNRGITLSRIEALHKEIGEEQFTILLSKVEPQAYQLVEQALGKEVL